jgi:hypothetical protein
MCVDSLLRNPFLTDNEHTGRTRSWKFETELAPGHREIDTPCPPSNFQWLGRHGPTQSLDGRIQWHGNCLAKQRLQRSISRFLPTQ